MGIEACSEISGCRDDEYRERREDERPLNEIELGHWMRRYIQPNTPDDEWTVDEGRSNRSETNRVRRCSSGIDRICVRPPAVDPKCDGISMDPVN